MRNAPRPCALWPALGQFAQAAREVRTEESERGRVTLEFDLRHVASQVERRMARIAQPEVNVGDSTAAGRELAVDDALLEEVRHDRRPRFRTWTCPLYTVVLGRSGKVETEVDLPLCRKQGIAIVQRPSGGGAVLIGPGTLQWTFALPHTLSPLLETISGAKRFCNRMLLESLTESLLPSRGPQSSCDRTLHDEPGGDLVLGDRKVGGIALKRRRSTSLIHGTILCDADLELVAACLRSPRREPEYRRHRRHSDFITNLGLCDPRLLELSITSRLRHACDTLRLGHDKLGRRPDEHCGEQDKQDG